jgi:hypothetical protein
MICFVFCGLGSAHDPVTRWTVQRWDVGEILLENGKLDGVGIEDWVVGIETHQLTTFLYVNRSDGGCAVQMMLKRKKSHGRKEEEKEEEEKRKWKKEKVSDEDIPKN